MSYKVLVADDEQEIRDILRIAFEQEDFEVIQAVNGVDAMEKIRANDLDIIILDIMMPVMDGLQVCETVRKEFDIPIIMVTAKEEEDDRLIGLEMGADDYITKPFSPREVVARVRAVLRRAGGNHKISDKTKISYPGLEINQERMEIVAFGKKLTMTNKEFDLLFFLASNPGIVYNRNQLLESIWGYTYFGDTRTVDTHIKRIRQKLDIPEDSVWQISTVWGVGYKFELDE